MIVPDNLTDWDAILANILPDRVAAPETQNNLLILILTLSKRVADVERRLNLEPAPLAEFTVTLQGNRLHRSKQRIWQLSDKGTLRSKLIGGKRPIFAASLAAYMQAESLD